MELLGKVHEWNDDRGFGFIQPFDDAAAAQRTFFHVRDYRQNGRRPEAGELVKYTANRQADGRWRATSVRRAASASPANVRSAKHSPPRALRMPGWLEALCVAAYGWALARWIHRGELPLEASFVVAGLCIVAYIAFAFDKHAAQNNAWRIPEKTLHLLELAGGWPGSLIAQRLLRHKTSKRSYRIAFRLVVAAHIGILLSWVHWR